MKIFIASMAFVLLVQPAFAQFGGGGGAFGGGSATFRGEDEVPKNPRQNELKKRQATRFELEDAGATFIEASVLMNVKADEYVAVFGVSQTGKTVSEASERMSATLASFQASLQTLGIKKDEIFVDFVAQNRVYAYKLEANVAREVLEGFDLKKNVVIHFKDKQMLDSLTEAAAKSEIFDLITVDYVVKDTAAIQQQLRAQAARIVRDKASQQQTLLGAKLLAPIQVVAEKPSIYYPSDLYDSYTAAESETIQTVYNKNDYVVQQARKNRTFFYNPLSADLFDAVINPVIVEPVVQFTFYFKVRYGNTIGKKKTGGF